jgi:hypothetical protein
MPCKCDYMEASGLEVQLSRVACLLDELDGKQWDSSHWRGYHPAVYNKPVVNGNKMVSELCERLQSADVTKYSLELQMWWRDHQKADKERVEHELARTQHAAERDAAISKLTPYERKLLGL